MSNAVKIRIKFLVISILHSYGSLFAFVGQARFQILEPIAWRRQRLYSTQIELKPYVLTKMFHAWFVFYQYY